MRTCRVVEGAHSGDSPSYGFPNYGFSELSGRVLEGLH